MILGHRQWAWTLGGARTCRTCRDFGHIGRPSKVAYNKKILSGVYLFEDLPHALRKYSVINLDSLVQKANNTLLLFQVPSSAHTRQSELTLSPSQALWLSPPAAALSPPTGASQGLELTTTFLGACASPGASPFPPPPSIHRIYHYNHPTDPAPYLSSKVVRPYHLSSIVSQSTIYNTSCSNFDFTLVSIYIPHIATPILTWNCRAVTEHCNCRRCSLPSSPPLVRIATFPFRLIRSLHRRNQT